METLERENPGHYRSIEYILALATHMPCDSDAFRRTLSVRFEARDARCGLLLMTSYPSKRHLGFTLGDTRYVKVVEMDESLNRLVPAQ